jgi:hypothetical protein
MPRNLLTVAVAEGIEVVVPITVPESITAVGRQDVVDAKLIKNIRAAVWSLNGVMLVFQDPNYRIKIVI